MFGHAHIFLCGVRAVTSSGSFCHVSNDKEAPLPSTRFVSHKATSSNLYIMEIRGQTVRVIGVVIVRVPVRVDKAEIVRTCQEIR